MNWYKTAKKKHPQHLVDHIWKILGVNVNTGEVLEIDKPKDKKDCDCQHSLDIHCDGDDGY